MLHNRSVELAKKFRVNLEVVSSLERKPGTKVKEVTKVEKTNIAGVAKDTSIARVALIGLQHNPGVAFQVFDLLSKHNINVDVILQSIGRRAPRTSPSRSIRRIWRSPSRSWRSTRRL